MKLDSAAVAKLAGLVICPTDGEGITRKKKRSKKLSWDYFDLDGEKIIDADEIQRINFLAIPPAWAKVWICPNKKGTLQAHGLDSKDRKQYRYHNDWVVTVSRLKFDAIREFAETLPRIRKAYNRDINLDGIPKDKVVACIIWLMNEYCIRVGSDEYARQNKTYGLSTLTEGHMTEVSGSEAEGDLDIKLKFIGKSGKNWERTIEDDHICRLILASKEVGGEKDTQDLFMYEDDNGVARDIKAEQINEYLNRVSGTTFTAKDFRTWSATWMAAQGFAVVEDPGTIKERKKVEKEVVGAVASHLGNTLAVCRSSYIHPTILSDWMDGTFANKWIKATVREKQITGLSKAEYTTLGYLK
jgi:DNA topoisomerase-1